MSATGRPRARKRFGQHFLHDRRVVERIIAHFDPRPGERIVEIGPGHGALTGALLDACGRLDAIELDRDLVSALPGRYLDHGELVVHSADAVDFDFRQLAVRGTALRIIGNLPYNISTPLIFHLLEQRSVINDMLFMLQREVVERMTAGAGNKTYGRLSVMVQFACEVENLFTVRPGAFQPPPKVDSAIVHLHPRRQLLHEVDPADLAQVVKQAFAQRRKTLRNTLRDLLPAAAIEAAGIDPAQRAEQLGLDQFAALANALTARKSTF
ncbi:16S rRNA (adenine1518-N6/adenine1519-N6)-dimethyltransferase [Methylohalomonas lacus]|uniref:Ribosomal RNA small subunit methyltransferase A n=1 Tax=Methylohalomonas lacus TaxID=398773 RepID=A0AAE3HL18_9GAMM|nr:16S rRNA (adenine(1518)-N(6)/adenine(1519)-N(6))-dimethyltransferase RsmA [Methylohalomonas lacus]MCS3904296.1 16S rRNA (adenine1518-N6/adenine1519-N6)-dimethyltransferase [Methylohalomonas lacus]